MAALESRGRVLDAPAQIAPDDRQIASHSVPLDRSERNFVRPQRDMQILAEEMHELIVDIDDPQRSMDPPAIDHLA
jgi:hypothetical protein